MTTTKQAPVTKVRVYYKSLSNPQSRNVDPQEEVQLKFIYTNLKQTPSELTWKQFRADLQVQLAKHLGKPVSSLDSVVSLIYNDQEFEIEATDETFLGQVLQSNTLDQRLDDVIILMSPKLLNRKQLSVMDTSEPLHVMELVDEGDKLKKTITIGLHQHGKLYVRLMNGATVSKLYFFTPDQLAQVAETLKKDIYDNFAEYAKLEVGSQNSAEDFAANYDVKVASTKTFSGVEWTMSTSFVLTKNSQKNSLHVLTSIKLSNNEKPTMFMVPLKWDDVKVSRNGPAVELASLEDIPSLSPVPTTVSEDAVELPFKVRMSSQYASDSIGQSFESLQDETGNNGAATNSNSRPFVQATFEHPHTVSGIIVKPLLASGWGSTYLAGTYLAYSQDEITWKNVLQLNGLTDGLTTYVVPNISAPYWRIRKDGDGYLSIGTWKILGTPSTEPITQVAGKPLEYYKDLTEKQTTNPQKGEDLVVVPRPDCKKYEDHGDSEFSLLVATDDQAALNALVEPSQSSYATDGKFNNFFNVPLTVVNKSDATLSFVKVEMAHKNQNDEWVEMNHVKLGVKYNGWNGAQYQFFEGHVANFEAGQADNLVFSGAISVTGEPGRDFNSRARAHQSLPQPLVIRVTVVDSTGKKRDILVEQANKPLDLYTHSYYAKYNKFDENKLRFITCDNVKTLERSHLAVYLDRENRQLQLKSSNGYTYSYVYDEFQKFMEKAKKESKKEIELEDGKSDERHVYMLFDAESDYQLYAFKVALQTETNSTEKVVLVKDLLDELAKM